MDEWGICSKPQAALVVSWRPLMCRQSTGGCVLSTLAVQARPLAPWGEAWTRSEGKQARGGWVALAVV